MIRRETEIDMDDDFGRRVLAMAAETPQVPQAFYNEEGDCIEVHLANEGFKTERIDKFVAVFRGRDSGEIVGAILKGVRRFIQQSLKECPGFAIEIQDGPIHLACLFTLGMWKQGDPVKGRLYQSLRDTANEFDLSVEVPELAC